MKLIRVILSILLSFELVFSGLVSGGGVRREMPSAEPGEYGQYVDLFTGTGGIPWMCGMLSPAAQVPFGCVSNGPDTSAVFGIAKIKLNTSGYYYEHRHILGFSLGRLSGTGARDYGMFRVTPAVGRNVSAPPTALAYSHKNEVASPGYYAVYLPGAGCVAEMTAANHTALQRYTFDTSKNACLYINASACLPDGHTENARVELIEGQNALKAETTLFETFSGRYGGLPVYLYAEWDLPAQAEVRTDEGVGAMLQFGDLKGKPVTLKLGVSFVSAENAKRNLHAETDGKGFDAVRGEAKQAWEERLGAVKVEADEEVKRTFYTSLYHTMLMPTDYTDVNGEYPGFDGNIHTAQGFTYRTDYSLWDTARNVHSLYTLLYPDVQNDSLESLMAMASQSGLMPRWPQGRGETRSMFGNPANLVFAESYLKGLSFDLKAAYAVLKTTVNDPKGREGSALYNEYGYLPDDMIEDDSVSKTLEYAWEDAAMAVLAEALGYGEDAALFAARAENYKNLWDAETGYFRPKNADGSWGKMYPNVISYVDDVFGTSLVRSYCEGSARQWRWSVQQDPQGLIALFGGNEVFVKELEDFMEDASLTRAAVNPGSGYWIGNQHDIHVAYLFNEAGRADLTQKWVRWTLDNRFSTDIDGLDGNDDGGTLSAWYVFSALGFYPNAGTDRYWLGSPCVQSAEVTLPNGKTLRIQAVDQSEKNVYVSEVLFNGEKTEGASLTHEQLLSGGTLTFYMSDTP